MLGRVGQVSILVSSSLAGNEVLCVVRFAFSGMDLSIGVRIVLPRVPGFVFQDIL